MDDGDTILADQCVKIDTKTKGNFKAKPTLSHKLKNGWTSIWKLQ